jgi:FkbH-like protein
MKSPLEYLSAYATKPDAPGDLQPISVTLVTNFTDDILERILGGMLLLEGWYPSITRAPYKQYALGLTDEKSLLYQTKSDLTFIYFDANSLRQSEFLDAAHRAQVLAGIKHYASRASGHIVVALLPLPYRGAYGHHFAQSPLYHSVVDFNHELKVLAAASPSLHLFDANKVMQHMGEARARNAREHHAFDMPFSSEYLVALAAEWMAYVRAATGRSRKCIVVDLDNTLWGGAVGEEGPLGIALGPDYPGIAYQNFQRALKTLVGNGIILAINSKNNEADVEEVFSKNPHMILSKDDFAAIRTNWEDKARNIESIAKELNIGLDSMVYIDDSPLEREVVRHAHPEVLTPDWSMPPEQYTDRLVDLNVFHQMSLTDEDRQKSRLYAEERMRKSSERAAGSTEDYLRSLNMKLHIATQNNVNIQRAAQLTQKTNQFNLTTKRYSEADIRAFIEQADVVATGEVTDTFGSYGIVLLAIITCKGTTADLDTFLMSCRVMGRGVESVFLDALMSELERRGVKEIRARFLPTAKNAPARSFLPGEGFVETASSSSAVEYVRPITAKLTEHVRATIITLT